MRSWYSIRFLVPAMGMAIALSAVTVEFFFLSSRLTESEIETTLATLRHSALQTQGAVNRELRRGDLTSAQQLLTELNFQPMITDAYVLDAQNVILLSNDRSHRGQPRELTTPLYAQTIERVRRTGVGDVIAEGDQGRAFGIYPVSLPIKEAGRLRGAPGALVVAFDFREKLDAVRADILRVTLHSAAFIVGPILLIFLVLHSRVTRRVNRIVAAAEQYLSGTVTRRARLKGRDEIGIIGDAFDRVADAAEAAKAELLEINKDLESRVAARTAQLQAEIEERRSAERELAASQSQIRAILDTAADAVIAMDANGQVLEFNPAAERLFGWRAEEIKGTSVSKLMPADTAAVHHQYVQRYRSTGQARIMGQEREVLALRRDGSLFPLELTINANDIGGRTLFIGVGRDLTARREAEAAMVAAQKSMMQAEKMAALGNLTAGVAHEVNTPIGIGVTAASHLRESGETFLAKYRAGGMRRADLDDFLEVSRESIAIIEGNLQRASELVRSFKQVAVDQSDGEVREVRLVSYVNQILTSLGPLLKKRPITVDIDMSPDLRVEMQAGAFAQILTNLVMNSLVHAFEPETSGQISIRASSHEGRVQMTYSDDGKGMDEETARRVFEPFFTTKRGTGGSGLGMHVVFNLVTQSLQGDIRCESSPGQGVRFFITFPTHTRNANLQTSGTPS